MHCVHVRVHFRLSLGANHGAGPHTKEAIHGQTLYIAKALYFQ